MRGVFPGDGRVWTAAAATFIVVGVLFVAYGLRPRETFLGSNSVAPRGDVAVVDGGQTLCVDHTRVPSGTGRVRFSIDTRQAPLPPLSLTMRLWQSPSRRGSGAVLRGSAPASIAGYRNIDVSLARSVPAAPGGYSFADICLTPGRGEIFLWGANGLDDTSRPLRLGRKQIADRVALWYLPEHHEQRSLLAQLGAVFRRASLFRPGWVGPWTFWLLLFGALPLLFYAGLRLIATAGTTRAGPLRLAAAVAVIAALNACVWATITPAYQSPDESEHFAAVQYVAETGHGVDLSLRPQKPVPWSTQEAVAIDATRELTVIERSQAKLPWLKAYQRDWEQRSHGLPRDNGGGAHPTTSAHTPLYYATMAPAYLLARGQSPFGQLWAVRIENALLASLVALFAVLTVLELLPDRRGLAVAAGLLVAFEPMFGFISGAVNNDTGVNVADAAIVYLCVRALRRGLAWRIGLGLGVALAVATLMKKTGYELWPPAAIAVLLALARERLRAQALLGVVAVVVSVLAVQKGFGLIDWHRAGASGAVAVNPGDAAAVPLHRTSAYLSWLWQILIPWQPPFLSTNYTIVHWPFFNIYIERGFAGFGWYAIFFPKWLYLLIVAVIGALIATAGRYLIVNRRRLLSGAWREWLVLALTPIVVFCAVEAAYMPPTGAPPLDGTGEQGRYLFPAIAALAALAVGACLGLGRRRAKVAATVLVACLMGLTFAGQFLQLSSFYT